MDSLHANLRALLTHERTLPQSATPPSQIATALGALALGTPNPPPPDVNPLSLRLPSVHRALLTYALARLGKFFSGTDALFQEGSSGIAANALYALALEIPTGANAQYTGFFQHIAKSQQPTGQFIAPDPYASPDLHWFDELVLLHALATHLTLPQMRPANNEQRTTALQRAIAFHTAETQPDHATTHPWALHAFARTEDGRMTANMLLHATQSQNAGRLDPISQLLIADALLAMSAKAP